MIALISALSYYSILIPIAHYTIALLNSHYSLIGITFNHLTDKYSQPAENQGTLVLIG